jgi:hypothetical protein
MNRCNFPTLEDLNAALNLHSRFADADVLAVVVVVLTATVNCLMSKRNLTGAAVGINA